jgi:stress response protein YsnF
VPFEGPTALLVCIPSTQNTTPPQAEILNNFDDEGVLRFSYRLLPDEDPEILKASIERDLNNLEFWANNVNREVETFNDSLTKRARNYIDARKERLLKARDQIAALNIPIARRADAPKTYTVPMVRKKVSIKKPQPSDERFNPEPTLAERSMKTFLKSFLQWRS